MKINEFIEKVNKVAYAKKDGDCIYICDDETSDYKNDYFLLLINTKTESMDTDYDWSCVENINDDQLRDVLNLTKELQDTPVKERFSEKKYRLRWIDSKFSELPGLHSFPRYLFISSNCWDMADNDLCGKTIFTESELNKLKKDNPRLAPAIDAMKEPVEDDE